MMKCRACNLSTLIHVCPLTDFFLDTQLKENKRQSNLFLNPSHLLLPSFDYRAMCPSVRQEKRGKVSSKCRSNTQSPEIKSIVFFIISHTSTRRADELREKSVKYPVERLDECLMLKISFTLEKISQYLSQGRKISKKTIFGRRKACEKSFILL